MTDFMVTSCLTFLKNEEVVWQTYYSLVIFEEHMDDIIIMLLHAFETHKVWCVVCYMTMHKHFLGRPDI